MPAFFQGSRRSEIAKSRKYRRIVALEENDSFRLPAS